MSNFIDSDSDAVKSKNIAYGAASLTRVLNGVEFPISKNELIKKYGDKEVNYSKGNLRTMREIVEKTIKEEFYTMAELVEACARRPL